MIRNFMCRTGVLITHEWFINALWLNKITVTIIIAISKYAICQLNIEMVTVPTQCIVYLSKVPWMDYGSMMTVCIGKVGY